MTTFRYEPVAAADVQLTFVSASAPDTIGVEFAVDGNALFEMNMGEEGIAMVMFDEIENVELSLHDLRALLVRGEGELRAWHSRLSTLGEMWSKP